MSINQLSNKQLYANDETIVNMESFETDKLDYGNNMSILDNHPTNNISGDEQVSICYLSIHHTF